VTTTVPQRWLGPRASGLVFKYNWFPGAKARGEERTSTVPVPYIKKSTLYQQRLGLGLGLGLKRNPTQDVAENGQDTN
jgi:hypothetical protein